jgi:Proteasome subunit
MVVSSRYTHLLRIIVSPLTSAPPGRICEQGGREFRVWTRVAVSDSSGFLNKICFYRTAIGLRVKDGVVLAVEKIIHSKLLMPESNKRILTIDRHIGYVST